MCVCVCVCKFLFCCHQLRSLHFSRFLKSNLLGQILNQKKKKIFFWQRATNMTWPWGLEYYYKKWIPSGGVVVCVCVESSRVDCPLYLIPVSACVCVYERKRPLNVVLRFSIEFHRQQQQQQQQQQQWHFDGSLDIWVLFVFQDKFWGFRTFFSFKTNKHRKTRGGRDYDFLGYMREL